jgi:hypothetical protein
MPIDLDWMHSKLPSIFKVFGNDLDKQIRSYNEILGTGPIERKKFRYAFSKMERTGTRTPHTTILIILSMLGHVDNRIPPFVGSIFLLEKHLSLSLAHGDPVSTYRSMLRSPKSYSDLVAELEIATTLRNMGADLVPHRKRNATSASNCDINCTLDSVVLNGDVKWFQNWLVSVHPETLIG